MICLMKTIIFKIATFQNSVENYNNQETLRSEFQFNLSTKTITEM